MTIFSDPSIGVLNIGNPVSTPPTTVYSPQTTQQLLLFVGSLTNVAQVATFSFWVLAGSGAPTITAGFVKLNVIDRPQRKGFTVPAGYDPITLSVPIQFESWVTQPPGTSMYPRFSVGGNTPGTIEFDIQKLEWMAGRGKLYASLPDRQVGAPATGDPPLVTVRSIDSTGVESNLIPPNLHGLEWIISGIQYDGDPLRDRNGNRRRQAAVVTLTEFIAAAGSGLDSPTTRAKARNAQMADHLGVIATAALNTIGVLTEAYVFNPTWQAKLSVLANNQTVNAPGNVSLTVRSVNQVLPPGSFVKIPSVLTIAAP